MKLLKAMIAGAVFVSGAASAASDTSTPVLQFHAKVSQGARVLYEGDAYVTTGERAEFNSVKEIPMKLNCKADVSVTKPMTYTDGIHLTLSSNPFNDGAITRFSYEVNIPGAEREQAFGSRCTVKHVTTHTYSSNPSFKIKVGETETFRDSDVAVTLTLVAKLDNAPAAIKTGMFAGQ